MQPVAAFAPVPYELLNGIDAQKSQLLENMRRLSSGHAAHDVLLWCARGTGKSATVSSVIGKLQAEEHNIPLVQLATDRRMPFPDHYIGLASSGTRLRPNVYIPVRPVPCT